MTKKHEPDSSEPGTGVKEITAQRFEAQEAVMMLLNATHSEPGAESWRVCVQNALRGRGAGRGGVGIQSRHACQK